MLHILKEHHQTINGNWQMVVKICLHVMHHVKSNLTGGADPIRGKGLRIHWKEKTALLPGQAVVIMFVVIG